MQCRNRNDTDAARLEFLTLLNAFVTVCNTMAYAHSRGVIHRDLKGQNVVLGDFGEVVVLDWGLAKLVDRRGEEAEFPYVVIDDQGIGEGLTIQGQTVGTPAYMAPEQASGRIDEIDRHTDLYGLGAMMCGNSDWSPPFSGDTHDVLRKVRNESPIRPREIWQKRACCPGGDLPESIGQEPGRSTSVGYRARPGGAGMAGNERREAQEERDRFHVVTRHVRHHQL